MAAVGSNEAGQDQVIQVDNKLTIVIEERVVSISSSTMEQKFQSLKEATVDKADESESSKSCIQRVPFMLRDNKNFKKYYEPRAVSVGPLHHCNPKLKRVEKLKLKLAGLFIRKHGLDKVVIFEKIKNDLKKLKECYDEKEIENYDDENLAWMFFVDGCALLHFIYCSAKDNRDEKLKELKIKNDHIVIAQQDLFLLENQLPYRLLKLLIASIVRGEKREKLTKSIYTFIDMIIDNIRGSAQQAEQPQHEPTHLLELLRDRLVGNNGHHVKEKTNGHKSTAEEKTKGKPPQNWHSFRNVRELKAAGIQLLPGDKCNHLTDIIFSLKFFIGTLKLPPLVVDDSTAPNFLNMIAYEMCPDFANDFEVTSYISFLDSLIDHRDDVKELRKERILINRLGSDKEVAKLFNAISTDLVPNTKIYSKVKDDIQKHYDKQCNTWIAEGYHNHFSSPWTLIAFVAAISALVLSFLQTWYTIHSV